MIKTLVLLCIFSWSIAAEWGTSFRVRTPNDGSEALDYELSIKLEDNEGKFKYLLKRDWERELGQKYIDDVVMLQHTPIAHLYYGIDYVNKESKNINYTTYNIGADIGYFKAGISIKEEIPLLNLALSTKAEVMDLEGKPDLEYIVSISVKSDIGENNIINLKSEVKKWITHKVNIFALYNHEYYNEKEDFQFKVGVGIKL